MEAKYCRASVSIQLRGAWARNRRRYRQRQSDVNVIQLTKSATHGVPLECLGQNG